MEDLDDIHGDDTHINSGTDAESSPAEEEKETVSDDDSHVESVDITDAMEKIGKDIDLENPKPLGED